MTSKNKREVKHFIETIILFLVLCIALRFKKENTDIRFVDFRLLYVVVVACVYGMKQGVLATILACGNYIYVINSSGTDASYLLYNLDSWLPLVMYVLAGLIVGYNTDSKRQEIAITNEKYELINEDYLNLKGAYKELDSVKGQLQKQILISKNSFSKVYEIAKELDTFNPKLIFFKAISILEEIMESDSVCIYMVNSENVNYNRLIANSFNLSDKLDSSIDLNKLPNLKRAIEENGVFINKQLDVNYPTYAAPIVENGETVAVVMIYNVDFEKYTLYYQNLFQTVVNLIQDNLIKAYKFNELVSKDSYIEGTNIYRAKEFNEHLQVIKDAKEDINLKYVQAKVELVTIKDFTSIDLWNHMKDILRSTDFVGCDENNDFHAVFMQTDVDHMSNIKERFNKAGIYIEMEDK